MENIKPVKGKVALVTGAAQGIGYGIARILLQNGAKVCLADIQAEKGTAAARILQQEWGKDSVMFVKCDVTSEPELTNVFTKTKDAFGRLDIVCNNAGILDESQWRKCVAINLSAVMHGTLLGVEHMSRDKGGNGGVIINTASVAGLMPGSVCPVYSTTKAGVVAFSRCMALFETSTKQGVRTNCICPNPVDTDLFHTMTGGQLATNMTEWDELIETFGRTLLPVSTVAEAFLRVAQDCSLNGAVLKVTPAGTEFVEQ